MDYQTLQFLRQRQVSDPKARPIFTITGSDLHNPDGAYAWTILQVPTLDAEAIMNELRKGQARLLFNPAGTRPRAYAGYNGHWEILSPFIYLANYLLSMFDKGQGMYSFQRSFCQTTTPRLHFRMVFGVLICFLVTWLLFEVLRAIILSGWIGLRKRQAQRRQQILASMLHNTEQV
jgi:hypothetical protein